MDVQSFILFRLKAVCFNLDDESNEKYKEKYIEVPNISNGIIYNDAIGIDGKILCGDYPKEYNDVMLPNCFCAILFCKSAKI